MAAYNFNLNNDYNNKLNGYISNNVCLADILDSSIANGTTNIGFDKSKSVSANHLYILSHFTQRNDDETITNFSYTFIPRKKNITISRTVDENTNEINITDNTNISYTINK